MVATAAPQQRVRKSRRPFSLWRFAGYVALVFVSFFMPALSGAGTPTAQAEPYQPCVLTSRGGVPAYRSAGDSFSFSGTGFGDFLPEITMFGFSTICSSVTRL